MNLAQANDCLAQLHSQISALSVREVPEFTPASDMAQAAALSKYMAAAYVLLKEKSNSITKLEQFMEAFKKHYPEGSAGQDHEGYFKAMLEISGADIKFPQESVH